jgi:hypothetical protein
MDDQRSEDAEAKVEQAVSNPAVDGSVAKSSTQSQSVEDQLEEGLLETFPASDPLASGRFE